MRKRVFGCTICRIWVRTKYHSLKRRQYWIFLETVTDFIGHQCSTAKAFGPGSVFDETSPFFYYLAGPGQQPMQCYLSFSSYLSLMRPSGSSAAVGRMANL